MKKLFLVTQTGDTILYVAAEDLQRIGEVYSMSKKVELISDKVEVLKNREQEKGFDMEYDNLRVLANQLHAALKSIAGAEAWISDEKVKGLWQSKIYPAIEKFNALET